MAVRLSVLRAGRPLPPGRFLVLISVRGWVDLRSIVRLEGWGQLKTPVASSGIEPATSRLVAQCLIQLRYWVPPSIWGPFSKRNIHSGGHSWRLDVLGMSSRQSNKCIVWLLQMLLRRNRQILEVDVKEHIQSDARYAKKNQNWPNILTKKATKYGGKKRRFCRLNRTPQTGFARNQLMCPWWLIRSVNPAWIFLPRGLSSLKRS
jgi:hypothetical protein